METEPRIPRNSWIVDRATREPTGYAPEEIHPELFASIATNGVIETPERLLDWLGSHDIDTPRDDRERRLFAMGSYTGASPPTSTLTSEYM